MNFGKMIGNLVMGKVIGDSVSKTRVLVVIDGCEQDMFSNETDPAKAAEDVANNHTRMFHADKWTVAVVEHAVHITKKK